MHPRENETQPTGNRPKNGPAEKIDNVDFLGNSASDQPIGCPAQLQARRGIAFPEFIARAGVGLDGAEEMAAAAMQL